MIKDVGLTFAGGGNKAFYQLGIMRRWRERLLPRVGGVAACSAGACVAALLLLTGRNPMRHEEVYRDALLHAFDGGGFERVREQSFPFLILTTAFPLMMPSVAAALLGLCLYKMDKGADRKKRDTPLAPRAGFAPAAYDARDCASPLELANQIIASSATPPFTSIGRFAGRRLLDGGIIDAVPAYLVESLSGIERNVILLTAPPESGAGVGAGARLYIGPSAPLPLKSWDLTRPHLIDEVIAQGERDADGYEARLTTFLGDSAPLLAE